jgi:hypothetical protein
MLMFIDLIFHIILFNLIDLDIIFKIYSPIIFVLTLITSFTISYFGRKVYIESFDKPIVDKVLDNLNLISIEDKIDEIIDEHFYKFKQIIK